MAVRRVELNVGRVPEKIGTRHSLIARKLGGRWIDNCT